MPKIVHFENLYGEGQNAVIEAMGLEIRGPRDSGAFYVRGDCFEYLQATNGPQSRRFTRLQDERCAIIERHEAHARHIFLAPGRMGAVFVGESTCDETLNCHGIVRLPSLVQDPDERRNLRSTFMPQITAAFVSLRIAQIARTVGTGHKWRPTLYPRP